MSSSSANFLILTAAGTSSRMGALPGGCPSKALLPLRGKSLLEHALDSFFSALELQAVVITAPRGMVSFFSNLDGVQKRSERVFVVEGSDTRQLSVRCGLKALRQKQSHLVDSGFVFIHDAARCLVSQEDIRNAAHAVKEHRAVTLASPCIDSIREVDGSERMVCILQRENLRLIQTPQVFDFSLIESAHDIAFESGSTNAGDDTELLFGDHDVFTVAGSRWNIKVTTPEDLRIAEAILDQRCRS